LKFVVSTYFIKHASGAHMNTKDKLDVEENDGKEAESHRVQAVTIWKKRRA
jgi:hypothetical protein